MSGEEKKRGEGGGAADAKIICSLFNCFVAKEARRGGKGFLFSPLPFQRKGTTNSE